MSTSEAPQVGVVMGSTSDWDGVMRHGVELLESLGVAVEVRVLSAHRTPDALTAWINDAESRGVKVFIAGAGGAAALPGVVAAATTRPVLGVPVKAWALDGLDSLLSMAQMPGGVPVATFSIGKPGAVNAALFAASVLGIADDALAKAVSDHRATQAEKILATGDPRDA